jgi:hypothetical protein
MPNRRATGRNYADEGVKNQAKAALLRNQLAPDYPGNECNPSVPSDSFNETNQGSNPANRSVIEFRAVDEDSKRVPGRPGPAGPM